MKTTWDMELTPVVASPLLSPAIWSQCTWSDVDVRAAVTGPYWDPLDADRLMHGLFIDGMF
jgi:hypothetical protein